MANTKVPVELSSTPGIVDNSNATAITIDSSENVGIGLTNQANKLQVDGDICIGKATTSADLKSTLKMRGANGSNELQVFDLVNDGENGRVDFKYNRAGSSAQTIMTFGATVGNVGIGTASPSSILHLSTSNDPKITLTDTGFGASADITGSNGNLRLNSQTATIFDMADSEIARFDSSGRFGIGCTPTGYAAEIQATSGGNALKLRGRSAAENAGWLAWTDNADNVEAAMYATANNLIFANTTSYTERMRIDSSGNVGIGTSSPTRALEVNTDGTAQFRLTRTDSTINGNNTIGTIEFVGTDDTSGTIGATIVATAGSTWGGGSYPTDLRFSTMTGSTLSERMRIDSSGKAIFKGVTENELYAQFLSAGASSTVSGYVGRASSVISGGTATDLGVGGGAGNLVFAAGGASERMRIDSSGNVLVGTTSQTFGEKLKVTTSGSGKNTAFFEFTSSDDRAVIISKHGFSTGATSRTHLAILNDANTQVGSIAATGTATTFNTSSDGRLKDVTGEARGLEVINELNPVAYNWKESGQADEGLIAQEVLDIVPNAVTGSEEKYYQMDYSKLVVHLVAGMKEQQAQIEALQSEINNLKGE